MKIFKTYLFVLTLLISTIVFIACDNDDDTHTHEPVPVTSTPVEILVSNQIINNDIDGTFQDIIEINKPCLFFVTANANGNYNGPVRNAGIILRIYLNDEEIASDFSFEGESASVTFSSSASSTLYLQPGSYNLRVERENVRVNSGFSLKVNYHAIYAEMSN
ncbi:MAG: hypothetical protein AAF611_18710 [Bacteroidota bacterium]